MILYFPTWTFSNLFQYNLSIFVQEFVPSATRQVLSDGMLTFNVVQTLLFGIVDSGVKSLKTIALAVVNVSIILVRAGRVVLGTLIGTLETYAPGKMWC